MTREKVLEYIASIDGWLSLHEGFFLYEAAKKLSKNGTIVEIGSWMGKSTICLATGIGQKGQVYAIDPHKGEYTKNNGIGKKSPTFKEFTGNLKKANVSTSVIPIVATSEKAATKWKLPIDFLFIDGLHDYKNTKLDFSLWSTFIINDGVIAFHDAFCGHVGPERIFLEKILHNKNWHGIGVVGSIMYARKGKASNLLEQANLLRHQLLIPFALRLNKTSLPQFIKFFLIHRIVKLLLINTFTWQLQFEQ